MWESWSKNLKKELFSFIDPAGGTTVLNANYQPVYTPATPVVLTGVKLDLTVGELSARQQLQDDSKYKIVLKDTTISRALKTTYNVTVNSVVYKITGIKKPKLPNSLITVYIKE